MDIPVTLIRVDAMPAPTHVSSPDGLRFNVQYADGKSRRFSFTKRAAIDESGPARRAMLSVLTRTPSLVFLQHNGISLVISHLTVWRGTCWTALRHLDINVRLEQQIGLGTSARDQRVRLPHLQALNIECHFDGPPMIHLFPSAAREIAHLLDIFDLPSTVSIVLSARGMESSLYNKVDSVSRADFGTTYFTH